MMMLLTCWVGVATRFLKDNPAAIPIHCCTHSLNLSLQDAGRKLENLLAYEMLFTKAVLFICN